MNEEMIKRLADYTLWVVRDHEGACDAVSSTLDPITLSDLAALVDEKSGGKWKVVPIEATSEQSVAAMNRGQGMDEALYPSIYRSMIAAAPKPEDAA